MICRPESLEEGREDTEKNIKVIHEGGNAILHNNSPYYSAVVNTKQNGHDMKLSGETKNKIVTFTSFEKVSLGSKLSGKGISVVSSGNYGVDREYKLQPKPSLLRRVLCRNYYFLYLRYFLFRHIAIRRWITPMIELLLDMIARL